MTADPFTLRIYVPDGDPEGVRIIDRMNWTGLGIVFPRGKWASVEWDNLCHCKRLITIIHFPDFLLLSSAHGILQFSLMVLRPLLHGVMWSACICANSNSY